VKSFVNLLDELANQIQSSVSRCPFHFEDKKLLKLLKIHDDLLETIESFNESFGVVVFALFIYTSGIVSCELYFGFSVIFDDSGSHLDLKMWLNVYGNILTFIPLLLTFLNLGFNCGKVQEKVSNSMHPSNLLSPIRPAGS
jgi:hypothetical protein